MSSQLVIVESPAKANTISRYLGKEFTVVSCNGHVRDLSPSRLSVKIDKNFEPEYYEIKEKKKLIHELKKLAEKADMVWLATDEDREGEAISWHLSEIMNLAPEKRKRIVFHEITKSAILQAKENPRDLDMNLVNAQQARRVLDRLVGYKLSPILWRKIKPKLSAGRVQSVALRLIVEREREIMNFKPKLYYNTYGYFSPINEKSNEYFRATLKTQFKTEKEAISFLHQIKEASFHVADKSVKKVLKSPPPPFTTSTLQQEAARKLGFTVARTMQIAQALYEAGHITYMRTDSVRLSDEALKKAAAQIKGLFGEKYVKTRQYKTKTKSAQEAHEAIRPTDLSISSLSLSSAENKLYELIWKRTLASQMANAEIEKTQLDIANTSNNEIFVASGEVIKFDGFLKLYIESTEDENGEESSGKLPDLKKGEQLRLLKAESIERFTRPPARYSEASLVKKLEELGIGRPSTYAPIISTIQKRDYVVKETRKGTLRTYQKILLENGKISTHQESEITGAEKNKLFPCSIGMIVNDFLVNHFSRIVDYQFTARLEDNFDKIAAGKKKKKKNVSEFYFKEFQPVVNKVLENFEKPVKDRLLGVDPETGLKVYAKLGKWGPYIQLGEKSDKQEPRYARLKTEQFLENITLEEALELFKLPRTLGKKDNHEIVVNLGRFGPYLTYMNKNYALPKKTDPYSITLEEAIDFLNKKLEGKTQEVLKEFQFENKTVQLINGRYGPYIKYNNNNYKIPSGTEVDQLDEEKIIEIIKSTSPTRKRRRYSKKS